MDTFTAFVQCTPNKSLQRESLILLDPRAGKERRFKLEANEYSDGVKGLQDPSESPAPSPSPPPTQRPGDGDKSAASGFGWFTLAVFLLIVIILVWRLYVTYQRRVEQRMLDYRSAQADRVLGDMQMVPNEDLDNDLI